MKGIVLSFMCLTMAVGLSCLGLQFYKGKKYFKVFRAALLISVIFYSVFYRYGFSFLGDSSTIDFLNGLLWLGLVFQLFWNGSYMFIFTGFSAGILCTLLLHPEGMSEETLFKKYKGESQQSPIILYRVLNLQKSGFLKKEVSGFYLTPKGTALAKCAWFFKRLLKVEVG